LGDVAAWRDAAREPDVAADGRALADGDATEDGRPGIDHNVVLDDGVAGTALVQLAGFVGGEALGAEGYGLVDAHVVADDGRLANDHARAVVDEEAVADLCAGVDVDTGGGVGYFRADARQQ